MERWQGSRFTKRSPCCGIELEQQQQQQQQRERLLPPSDDIDLCEQLTLDFVNENYIQCAWPGCGYTIEHTGGCEHVQCRCGRSTCHGCGKALITDDILRIALIRKKTSPADLAAGGIRLPGFINLAEQAVVTAPLVTAFNVAAIQYIIPRTGRTYMVDPGITLYTYLCKAAFGSENVCPADTEENHVCFPKMLLDACLGETTDYDVHGPVAAEILFESPTWADAFPVASMRFVRAFHSAVRDFVTTGEERGTDHQHATVASFLRRLVIHARKRFRDMPVDDINHMCNPHGINLCVEPGRRMHL